MIGTSVEQVVETSADKMQEQYRDRYIPLIRNVKIRSAIGFVLLGSSVLFTTTILGDGRIEAIVPINVVSWMISLLFTDKYVHKYPQRYTTYLIASHLKAATIMALFLWILGAAVGFHGAPPSVLWSGFLCFTIADALISLLRRRDFQERAFLGENAFSREIPVDTSPTSDMPPELSSLDTRAILSQVRSGLDRTLVHFLEEKLPDHLEGFQEVLTLDDLTGKEDSAYPALVGLLIGRTRLNEVRRLNRFLQYCANRITMGGYFVVPYVPLENVTADLKKRYSGFLYRLIFLAHFIWYRAIPKIPWLDRLYFSSNFSWFDTIYLTITKRRNRVLSKAEVWGRLAFHGMEVVAESNGEGERYLLARRVSFPIQNKRPSYYPVVALEKVGLDGKIIRTHKIRTMFPFSEFLQKRIFQDHGLTSTGKFSNDFRLTEVGRFLRKYWLDELPQIFNWLRGDIKLVGMRATSRHFLSLYPKNVYNLYIQIKPGLVPPIFDESTGGFDQIVKVEQTYLQRYWERPFRTDLGCLMQTFTDIFFRGIRSK